MRPSLHLLLLLLVLPLAVGGMLAPFPARGGLEHEPPYLLSGQVSTDRGPVDGARVRVPTRPRAHTTDRDGRFQLFADRADALLAAWKPGYFIGAARPVDGVVALRLEPLPDRDNPDYRWVDPDPASGDRHSCGTCHAEITREWQASGHSRSATGKHFRSLYTGTDWDGRRTVGWGLLEQHPLGAGVCSSCHAPSLASDDPAFYDLRQVQGVAARGVHCDYCHKIADVGTGQLGLTHGRFNLQLLRPGRGQVFFGSLDDATRGDDAYSPLYRESRYCASCHEGIVFGVPVYTTYSEWRASPARRQGKECQSCHMRPTGQMTNIAPGHGGRERPPQTLASHRFFDPDQQTMLRRCIRLSAQLQPREAQIRIVAEDVGHRVPTGYIDRHLIVVARAWGTNGQPLKPSGGPTLPSAAGALQGQPGRLYAKLLHDEHGHSPAPFWDAEHDWVDNRLRPGEPDTLTLTFAADVARLQVRVLYRRFWEEVARSKGWPDRDIVVCEQVWKQDSLP
jgi:hypothetical protein